MNFDYNEVTLPPEAVFKISPSGIGEFFNNPVIWYKQHVLKDPDAGFKGSTGSLLGTVVHAIAENYVLNGAKNVAEDVDKFLSTITDSKINVDEIKELYPDMAKALINDYIRHNKPTEVETTLRTYIKDEVYVAGTCDNRTNSIVVDYKNVTTKPNTEIIPFNYLIQLLAYAYMYKKEGIEIDRVRLVYTVRPTKTLPVRVFAVTKLITDEDWELIENTLTLIADSVLAVKKQPELAYLIFKSMQFKEK